MPVFEKIGYTQHARGRMNERRIGRKDDEFTWRTGDGRPGKQDSRIYESGRYRVVVTEGHGTARVFTVVRLRGQR